MKFGLSQEQYEFILRTVVHPLNIERAKVWCYGSRARGDHQKFSDLDLMVETSADVSRKLSELREVLEESNFPFKVDLVDLREFADSYKPFYERDKVEFT